MATEKCNIETYYEIENGPLAGYELTIIIKEFYYTPSEAMTRTYPGCDESIEIEEIEALLIIDSARGEEVKFKPHCFNSGEGMEKIINSIFENVASELYEDRAAAELDAADFIYQCRKEQEWI